MKYTLLGPVYSALGETTKRLEKTRIISDFLRDVSEDDLENALLLLQGRVYPRWDRRTLGVSSNLAVKAVAQATGVAEKAVKDAWREQGDLGLVVESLLAKSRQATLFAHEVSLKEVVDKLRSLTSIEGGGSVGKKLKTITSLLTAADPKMARYLLGTILEELRVGVAEGVVRDAIAWAFLDAPVEDGQVTDREAYNEVVQHVQSAYDRCSDFGTVALKAKAEGVQGLNSITFELGTPVRVMLAQREVSVAAAFERVGAPCALEFKYDGFRMQIHKLGDRVQIFTRRLEEVTTQFPEVVKAVREHVKASRCLLDCEAVGFDPATGLYTAFQAISQRIRRKYDIPEMAKKLPVELVVFDVLFVDGEEILDKPFQERRKVLEGLIPEQDKVIRPSRYLLTEDVAEGEDFYQISLGAGNEGLMAKNLEGPYKPGSRVGFWVKIKPTMDTMDLVVVAAEWGEGKRSGWFTSFTLACADPSGEGFLTVGKVGTGLKELDSDDPQAVTFDKLTKLLQGDVFEENGREATVHPRIVLEIKFEEVQKSPTYESGYALRFPRVVQLRDDRGPEDITTLDEVDVAFRVQKS